MSNIDDKIKQAMDAEYAQEWEKLGAEPRLDEMVMEAFRGRNRGMNILFMVLTIVLFVGMLFLIREYAAAENTKALISYAMLIGFSMMAIGMLKLWIWLEMERNSTSREIKRLELQIAMLARQLGREGTAQ